MKFQVNKALERMSPFIVMEMLERAQVYEAAGEKVIHFEVGEPDFDLPQSARGAIEKAMNQGLTHYTHSLGLKELRQEIANLYARDYNLSISPERVLVTSGSSAAILMMIKLLCSAGDEVIISNPGYACYANFLIACNVEPIEVEVTAEDNFQFQIERIKKAITPRTKAIILNSPMNPCGTLVTDQVYREISELNIPIISDEIYHGLVYEEPIKSALNFNDNAIVINGFSKRWAMTGLRLGWIIAPEELIRPLQILQQNLFICAPTLSQYAGIEVLKNGWEETDKMLQMYDLRRKYMVERLYAMGMKIAAQPKGAFYLLCDITDYDSDSYKFCIEVLDHAKVALTPGIDFGSKGEGFIRFSYATSLDNIKEGMDRLEKYLDKTKSNILAEKYAEEGNN